MSIAQRLRRLDDRVLGPPRPTRYPLWMRAGGGLAFFAMTGSLRLAASRTLGSEENGTVAAWYLVIGGGAALAVTAYVLRHPRPARDQYGLAALAAFWIALGTLPFLFEPGARSQPLVLLYVAMIAGGAVLGGLAFRQWREARAEERVRSC